MVRIAVFEPIEIIFKLGWEHRKLTAEVCYILNGSNRCLYWVYHIYFDVLNRIVEYLFRWFWKLKYFYSLICIRSAYFDGRVEYITSISFDVIYPIVRLIEGFLYHIFVHKLLFLIRIYLWCSYSIQRINFYCWLSNI